MSDDHPPNDLPSDEYPYGVDTIRLRISWPAAPASRGYNGRKWSMRPLRGQTGGARQDAPGADAVTANRDGLAVTSPGHVPVFPEQGQAVPANQAIEKGGPASELLAAFRALRAGAPQDRGPTAKEAAAPGTAGRDGNGPGSAPPITIAASLPLGGRSTNAPASGDAGSTTGRLGTVRPNYASQLGDLSMRHETGYSPGHEGKAAGVVSRGAKDPGGLSYGAYQLASSEAGGRQVQAFLKSPEGARWADRFKGMDPTQPGGAFAHEWKRIAANEPDEFFQAQHEYIKRTHYDPVAQNVQHATGLDINQRSRALQNVVWSMSVQHGGAASLVTDAVQQASPQDSLSNAEYDRKLIIQLYAVRNAYVDKWHHPELKTRYVAEQHDALRELEGEHP